MDRSTEHFTDTDFDICDIIIDTANLSDKTTFELQDLVARAFDGYEIKIYHGLKANKPKWRKFFEGVVDDKAAMLKSINTDAAFILFIGYNSKNTAFPVAMEILCYNDLPLTIFGMEVLVRLIEKNQKVIKSLQDRGVVGAILGETRFFRGDQRLVDEDQW